MSKHAVIGLTKSIAAHYGLENTKIRANAIAPAWIATGMTALVIESELDPIGSKATAAVAILQH